MSLRNDTQLAALADDLYALAQTPIDIEGKTKVQIEQAAKDRIKQHMDKVCAYLIQYMVVKGIKITLDSGTTDIETYDSGQGSNHTPGSPTDFAAASYPVTGTVIAPFKKDGTQNNATTGHIE